MPHPIPGNLDLLEAENKFLKQTLNVLRLELEKKQSQQTEETTEEPSEPPKTADEAVEKASKL